MSFWIVISQYFLCFFLVQILCFKRRALFPLLVSFPARFLVFFFCFSDSEAKDRNESFSFFQRALEQEALWVSLLFCVSLFWAQIWCARFSFTRREADADAFSFARTFLWSEMNSLYNRRELEMRKTNSLSFFSESLEKKEKGARSLEISARARALSRRTRRSARGKNGRNLSRTFTCTRSCAFYSREFFFLSSCVRFVLRALGFDDILLSRFQNEDIFRFSFCFLGAKLRKRGKWERKRRHEVRKERGYFFLFFGGKDLSVVLPKRTQTWIITFFVKVGGEGVQLAFAAFYFVQRR